jgi:dTDP-4-amino-4,6-dideoxygalactose transaminase
MIPLFGVQRQTERLRAAFDARMAAVLDHGRFILGPEVDELERRMAAYCGAAEAVGVGSGWDALFIALAGEGVGPGDAVFVPGFTFTATADAVLACGATPVFVDVEPDSCNMDPARLAEAVAAVRKAGALTPRATIPVDLFGLPADYAALADAAPGLFQLADAAQSFGGERGGRRTGALAPATAFSFYPTKPLGALGDGGAILTDDPARAARWRAIRNCGRGPDGLQAEPSGPTARLDTLQAAALLAKLDAFDAELARRREIAAFYGAALSGLAELPPPEAEADSAWALYTIRADRRDALRARLGEAGVPSAIYYSKPLPAHPAFARWAPPPGTLPVSERLAERVLSLPMHAELTDAEVETVCAAVAEALAR